MAINASVSVKNLLAYFGSRSTVSSVQLVSRLIEEHTDYAPRSRRSILRTLEPWSEKTSSSTSSTPTVSFRMQYITDWQLEIESFYNPDRTAELHGRLFIVGLTLADSALRQLLLTDGFIDELMDQVTGLQQFFSDSGLSLYQSAYSNRSTAQPEAVVAVPAKPNAVRSKNNKYWFAHLAQDVTSVSKQDTYTRVTFSFVINEGAYGGDPKISDMMLRGDTNYLFTKINVGDRVVGYDAYKLRSAYGIFKVLTAEYETVTGEESKGNLMMERIQLFNPFPTIEVIRGLSQFDATFFTESNQTISALSVQQYYQLEALAQQGVVRETYRPNFLPEGDNTKTVDQLDFENDIESIASVISLKTVLPPLAIGLFGNWGSGKSFFMDKLHVRVQDKASEKKDVYVEDVVQVKFNSWHYNDANLWASLITEIFGALNDYSQQEDHKNEIRKMEDTLQVSSLQKAFIQGQVVEYQGKVDALKTDQIKKRQELTDISGISLLKLFLSDEKISKDFSELNNQNIESIVADEHQIDAYISEVQSGTNQLSYFFHEALVVKGWRWVWLILGAAFVYVLVLLLKYPLASFWNEASLKTSVLFSGGLAFIARLATAVKPYWETFTKTRDRLVSLKKTIESRKQVINPVLDANEQKLVSLRESLVQVDQEISDTKVKLDNIRSGKKLMLFIEERSADKGYASQLGMISMVRKDFETLDLLLREQHESQSRPLTPDENPLNVKLKIERIILYIDDLDRCNQDVVVRVLEAIHLLLAFKLFVVIVGVDPRWLNNALNDKMDLLFGRAKKAGAGEEESLTVPIATSYDYLEKIFQIPFLIKPVSQLGRESLISYLLKDEMAQKQVEKSIVPLAIATAKPVVTENRPLVEPVAPAEPFTPAVVYQPALQSVRFFAGELRFIQQLSPVFGNSPRNINRFLNIYRILRSHRSLKISNYASEYEYLPVLFMLSILVGRPSLAGSFFAAVDGTSDMLQLNDVLIEIESRTEAAAKPLIALVGELRGLMDYGFDQYPVINFQKNLELISRFSFRTIMASNS